MLALISALFLQAVAAPELPPLSAEQVIFDVTPPNPPLRFYPSRAQNLGKTGKAVIDCLIGASGGLTDCRVVSETPERWRFGEAAVNMRVLFRARPTGKDGQPVLGRRVVLTLNFNLS